MAAITQQKCFNHDVREAAAKCPSCQRFYCRECITEHDGRMTCAACLAKQTEVEDKPASTVGPRIVRSLQVAMALLVLWAVFASMGGLLLRLESTFHEGSFWNGDTEASE